MRDATNELVGAGMEKVDRAMDWSGKISDGDKKTFFRLKE
jgi:hypothetical protein